MASSTSMPLPHYFSPMMARGAAAVLASLVRGGCLPWRSSGGRLIGKSPATARMVRRVIHAKERACANGGKVAEEGWMNLSKVRPMRGPGLLTATSSARKRTGPAVHRSECQECAPKIREARLSPGRGPSRHSHTVDATNSARAPSSGGRPSFLAGASLGFRRAQAGRRGAHLIGRARGGAGAGAGACRRGRPGGRRRGDGRGHRRGWSWRRRGCGGGWR